MAKHWGLQFQKRVEDFGKKFAGSRCEVASADEDLSQAERNCSKARYDLIELKREMEAKKRALTRLMEMGPEGLRKIEGEHEPEMSLDQFLIALDKRGIA